MTGESMCSDSDAQTAIAERLSPVYTRIDLSIPAQRAVANSVREIMGLPNLVEITEVQNDNPKEGEL